MPAVIGEPAINTHKGALGELQGSSPVDFMLLALGHIHEDREVAVGIQADMQLDGSLFLSEFGPGKGGEAKIDHRGVKQVELPFERESMFGSHQLTPYRIHVSG